MTPTTKNECELIASWKKGNDKAFDQLFELHFPKLLRFASRYTTDSELAKEMTMDVMFKAWQKKDILIAQTEGLGPFLFHALKALIIDQYRKKRHHFLSTDENQNEAIAEEQTDDRLNYRELNALYHKSLNHLSPQRRLVFEMKEEQGMSRQEIANELSISARTVNRHLTDAFQTVRSFIQTNSDLSILLLLISQF